MAQSIITPPIAADEFRSARWLPGGWLQTAIPPFLAGLPESGAGAGLLAGHEDLRIPLGEGEGELSARLNRAPSNQKPAIGQQSKAELVVLFHGITGSTEATYMRRLAAKALAAGFDVLRVNLRGCGGSAPLSPKVYHAGLAADARAVIQFASTTLNAHAIHLAGFSLGGHLALRAAGEWGDSPPAALRSMAAISPPLCLHACSAAINRRPNWLFQRHIVQGLCGLYREKAVLFPDAYPQDRIAGVRTIRQYDDAVIAPLHGFAGVDDYYHRASAIAHVDAIAVPTLIVTAEDDPLIPAAEHREAMRRAGPHMRWLIPRAGGHVGFVARGNAGEDRHWAENRVVDFWRSL